MKLSDMISAINPIVAQFFVNDMMIRYFLLFWGSFLFLMAGDNLILRAAVVLIVSRSSSNATLK